MGEIIPTAEHSTKTPRRAFICYTRCWPCITFQHPGGNHRWADQEDIDHAIAIGRPESAEGTCGCYCARGPLLDEDDVPPWGEDDVPLIDGTPCLLCGEGGACGYDAEGRPMIHAVGAEDE